MDEPAETCNGLLNRGETSQSLGGAAGQFIQTHAMSAGENRFAAGATYDRSRVDFQQSSELGYINPDRSITGLGAFGDGVTGGDVDGEPFDTRVDLHGIVQTWSVYASDTITLGSRVHATASARYNRSSVDNRDNILPGGGPGSLDGDYVFQRLNPGAGVTFALNPSVRLYGGYNEGSRAPTSIELGCADPEEPCKLPNALAGDPPLAQVVTRTFETGASGTAHGLSWRAGYFWMGNSDDILFVTAEQTGFGYFKNFGSTRRQGLELGATHHRGRFGFGANYTLLDATYQSEEVVNGESNSTNDAAEEGAPGLEGTIAIAPGDRLPLIPRHLFKAFGDVAITRALSLDVDFLASAGSFARGNENGAHEPDDVYYLGPGSSGAYSVVNLSARYALGKGISLLLRVNNLFDQDYNTAAQLGPAGFHADGTFASREFPPIDGEYPVRQTTFFAPGAPIQAWFGATVKF